MSHSQASPPSRPDTASDGRRPSRGGLGTATVVGVILAVVLGGYVVSAALSEPAGPPTGIPGVVTIRPLSGWVLAQRGTSFVLLTRGSGNLAAVAYVPYTDTPSSLARSYIESDLSVQLSQLSVSNQAENILLGSGAPGVRFGYIGVVAETGTSIEGEVTVVVTSSGHGVVFDGWAPAGLLSFVRSDIRTMVSESEVA